MDPQDLVPLVNYVTQLNCGSIAVDSRIDNNGAFIFPVHVALL